MKLKNSITASSITNFLAAGALLRYSTAASLEEPQWILLEGPFQPASDADSDEITVFFPEFYDLHSSLKLRAQIEHRLTSLELRQICELYLATAGVVSSPLTKAPWIEPEKGDFAQAFSLIQQRIRAGEIQKAVPVVFDRSAQSVTDLEKVQMILRLIEAPPALFVYGFWQSHQGRSMGVLGASPEVLFEYQDQCLRTMALAGTCPKNEIQARDSLLQDQKELQEHQLVLEDIKSVLSRLGPMTTNGPHILELPSLLHLKTDIEVQCDHQPDFSRLIESLHPTAALGVAPRSQDYKWMAKLPGQEGRKAFGGPFAFLSQDQALCLVAIRNLQWNESASMIGSGCGIVDASELEREWRELFQKRLSVRKILGLES